MNVPNDSAPTDLARAYRDALEATGAMEPEEGPPVRDEHAPATRASPPERTSPTEIIEAALFVGGIELDGNRLASLLKGEFTAESVDRLIADLNRRYAAEERPYEIRREETLYRLALREEFEPVRRRVYGVGPKEVTLSREALEVLSVIAYRQPISRQQIEQLRDGNAGNVIRWLVRRQLISLRRDDGTTHYVTTERFLDAFGLANLEELPRAEKLAFK